MARRHAGSTFLARRLRIEPLPGLYSALPIKNFPDRCPFLLALRMARYSRRAVTSQFASQEQKPKNTQIIRPPLFSSLQYRLVGVTRRLEPQQRLADSSAADSKFNVGPSPSVTEVQ